MINKVMEYLIELFPNPKPELNYNSDFQCLVAVILSAQCTDKRVNVVTSTLFRDYPDSVSMQKLTQTDLEKLIYSTGFYHNKAKNILALCKVLNEKFNGKVPNDPEVLETLPGVGRKTANVVSSALFGAKKLGVDTHVLRVTNRLGLVDAKTPLEVEKQWTKKYPQFVNHDSHFRLVLFGRYHCKAQNPNCANCKLSGECKFFKSKNL
ncbi:MAG: endonuclease III [Clostridia bacterium]|nr:endonuclease III [Clostridia bacterium]